MPAPYCRLVVPIHNGLEFLEPMLRSLGACTDPSHYELVLSDDASDEPTRTFLDSVSMADFGLPLETTVLRSDENRGFSATCNAGAKGAESEFLVFLNTDLEFGPGWLETLIAAAATPNPSPQFVPARAGTHRPSPARGEGAIGAVGCKLLYPDGTIQHGGVFLREDRLDRVPLIASHDHVGKPGDDPEANRKQDLLAVTAAAILVRREAFEAVGGFDEGYVNGYEDVDLCLKLGQAGWRIVYEPACELVHFESKSGAKRFAHSKRNQRRFLERWGGKVRPEVLVTPHLEVGPHPNWSADCAFEPWVQSRTPSVHIIIESGGSPSALAITLESLFAARLGLDDKVTVLANPSEMDTISYLRLCDGFDDAFSWKMGGSWTEAAGDSHDFIAFLEPGAIATQGWLARLIPWAGQDGIGAAGPMMTGAVGDQDAMALLPSGSSGAFSPNDLAHYLSRQFRGQAQNVQGLEAACLLLPVSRALEAAEAGVPRRFIPQWLIEQGHGLLAAKDVFIHLEPCFAGRPAALAA